MHAKLPWSVVKTVRRLIHTHHYNAVDASFTFLHSRDDRAIDNPRFVQSLWLIILTPKDLCMVSKESEINEK